MSVHIWAPALMVRAALMPTSGKALAGALALASIIASCTEGLAVPNDCPAADAAAAATQPSIRGAINVTVQRLSAGCGTVLVSSGIPLAPGALEPSALAQVRLFVGGKEQRLHVEALQGTHADGSLRAVLLQFEYPLRFDRPVAGQLVLGEPRTTRDIAAPSGARGNPQAVVLPTDADYLVSTDLVGPTITVSQASQISPLFQKYENDFRTFADLHWNRNGATWSENYYDRALIYYAWWVRSGNVEYWKRGTALATSYRRDYLEAHGYNTSAHWSQIEGLEVHYLLTGDEASRTAVGRVADTFTVPFYMDHLHDLAAQMDNRIQARTLQAFLSAWRINAPSQLGKKWAPLLRQALTSIIASQDVSGAYLFTSEKTQCGHNQPFMVGLLNDAMIKYYTYFDRDPRIVSSVRKADDYLWAHDWNSAARAFAYIDGPCPEADGGRTNAPARDLNNMIVNGFGWLGQRTGTAAYRKMAEEIFAGGVSGAWLEGSKQFNEEYASSFRYLAYSQ